MQTQTQTNKAIGMNMTKARTDTRPDGRYDTYTIETPIRFRWKVDGNEREIETQTVQVRYGLTAGDQSAYIMPNGVEDYDPETAQLTLVGIKYPDNTRGWEGVKYDGLPRTSRSEAVMKYLGFHYADCGCGNKK